MNRKIGLEEFAYPFRHLLSIFGFAFPYDHHLPPGTFQRFEIPLITRGIAKPLRFPEVCILNWHYATVTTVMHVKEAAVDIDNLSTSNKYQIGFAGETFLVKRISITHPMHD